MRNSHCRIEEKRGNLAGLRILFGWRDRAAEQKEPKHQPDGEQDLPGTPQVKILPTLVAKPKPQVPEQPLDAHDFAQQTSDHHDNESTEQKADSFDLALWLCAAESRCQKQSSRYDRP